MSVLLFLIVSYILLSASLYTVFEKAGVPGWKALVPGLNFVDWCPIIGRPKWYAALLLIPLVNIFIYAGICVDMVRSFGKYRFRDSALAVIYAPLSFFILGAKEENKYLGPTLDAEQRYAAKMQEALERNDTKTLRKLKAENPYKKSQPREWAEAIVFAVFAAAFIRMFFIEPYVIPTPSMEGSLLVGDFLFVSKVHYGIRTPMTVAQLPLVHNTIPFLGNESYLKSPKLSYYRLPALEKIERNHPVVFNHPEGDSIIMGKTRNYSVMDLRRLNLQDHPQFRNEKVRTRPIDKKDHYIKRCVALPGDKIEIKDRQLYINDAPATNPKNIQYLYQVNTNGAAINDQKLKEWGINYDDVDNNTNRPVRQYHLDNFQLEKVISLGDNIEVIPVKMEERPGYLFPHDPINFPGWTMDNYGPFVIPKKGVTVTITPKNIALYRRVIDAYEHKDLEIKNGRVFINGEQATNYTFQQDYYWMMGDNRHNSEDSRVWGFVPEDHIVGKPLFIWFSTKNNSIFNGINWSRIFSGANKMEG